MKVLGNFVVFNLVMVDSTDFVACQEKIGMEEELEVLLASKDLYSSKEMDYTMIEEIFENYMPQKFEQD